jgi:transcriptional regulator of acetoin/glycerol metabolism
VPNALTRHIDNVIALGRDGRTPLGSDAASVFHRSWARCMSQYGLDPTRPKRARILPSDVVRTHQERMEGFLRVARSGMEDLYRRVADLAYMVLLTDADGIAVDYISNPVTEPQLKAAGLTLGADWSEANAGTCGVGTSLIERTAITCHQVDHFDATHIGLTCSSAPLFAPDGALLGVLDISALHSPSARESQHLARQLVTMYAQMIEDANFLRTFGKHWILRLGRACGLVEVSGEVMFAFDEDAVIVGVNTGARRRFGGPLPGEAAQEPLVGRNLLDVLDLGFDALWALARGHGTPAREVAGRYPFHNERLFPAVIPPRTRASAAAAATPSRSAAPAPMSAQAGALDRLAGDDPTMQMLSRHAKRLVDSQVSLLIQGETGAGKEVLAKALHDHSARADKPFVAVNCASIPETLIESELFGYTAGSFTGGKSKGMKGLIAQSDGGTLFLDEIGDMPLHLQTRFLRVLSESEVMPLGADQPIRVKLNVIAATHRDLRAAIERGQFREDLYYRLSGAVLRLPPLRERRDIAYLVHTILAEEASRLGRTGRLTPQALDLLTSHRWPGNVRELRNALRYALALAGDAPVTPDELPADIGRGGAGASVSFLAAESLPSIEPDVAHDGERLLRALRRHKWSVTSAARELNICRATIYRQMKRYGITAPNQL